MGLKNSGVTKSPNKKELNSSRSQQNILSAACMLFAKNGFDGTTSREIAEAAGCSEGLIFKYFKDKKTLFNTLVINWVNQCILDLEALPETTCLADELILLLNCFFDIYEDKADLNKIYLSQRFNGNKHDDLSQYRNSYVAKRNEIALARLKKYQENGEINEDVDIIQLLELFQGYALVEVLFRDMDLAKKNIKIKSLVDLMLSGIKKDKK